MAIVVLGTVFVDIKGFPNDAYSPTGRNAGWVEIVHGGVGRNVAEDIANMELRPKLVSIVDDTASGAEVLAKLRDHKVNTDHVLVRPDGMGIWLAVFDNEGDLAGSISKRPDMDALAELLEEKGDEIFADADSIVVEIDMDREIIKQVFRFARKYSKKVFAVVSNMTIAVERRDLLRNTSCFVCNLQEAGLFFSEDFENVPPEELAPMLVDRVRGGEIPRMVVTMGGEGAVYATMEGEYGWCPALNVDVVDTTGCGDAFFAGVCIGQTYGKSLRESCQMGIRLASSVIATRENVCPRFLPAEFGLS